MLSSKDIRLQSILKHCDPQTGDQFLPLQIEATANVWFLKNLKTYSGSTSAPCPAQLTDLLASLQKIGITDIPAGLDMIAPHLQQIVEGVNKIDNLAPGTLDTIENLSKDPKARTAM